MNLARAILNMTEAQFDLCVSRGAIDVWETRALDDGTAKIVAICMNLNVENRWLIHGFRPSCRCGKCASVPPLETCLN